MLLCSRLFKNTSILCTCCCVQHSSKIRQQCVHVAVFNTVQKYVNISWHCSLEEGFGCPQEFSNNRQIFHGRRSQSSKNRCSVQRLADFAFVSRILWKFIRTAFRESEHAGRNVHLQFASSWQLHLVCTAISTLPHCSSSEQVGGPLHKNVNLSHAIEKLNKYNTIFKTRVSFFLTEVRRNETNVAEEYCWAITDGGVLMLRPIFLYCVPMSACKRTPFNHMHTKFRLPADLPDRKYCVTSSVGTYFF